jgi:hypothetical protein
MCILWVGVEFMCIRLSIEMNVRNGEATGRLVLVARVDLFGQKALIKQLNPSSLLT